MSQLLFWVTNKQDQQQDPEAAERIISRASSLSSSPKGSKRSSGTDLGEVGDVAIEPDTTAPDNSSDEGGYYYEETAVSALTIQATTREESLTDSFEGTEITMAAPRQLDKYGFILNIDERGVVYERALSPHKNEYLSSGVPAFAEVQTTVRRERKWSTALDAWERRRPKKIRDRLRKGIPDSVRGRVWLALGGGIRKPGLYQEIVQKTSDAMMEKYKEEAASQSMTTSSQNGASTNPKMNNVREESSGTMPSPTASSSDVSTPTRGIDDDFRNAQRSNGSIRARKTLSPSSKGSQFSPPPPSDQGDYAYSKAFRTVQDTIERDIHRTYPRHNLFFQDDNDRDDEAITNAASSLLGISGICDPELASLILNLEQDIKAITTKGATSTRLIADASPSPSRPSNNNYNKLTLPQGQAALRRVLRAYSYYDREISYCQGMNFIAGMFLTVMSEEEAFWLLVAVMHDKPCEMRGMFGEGMRETHKVLHVAERLIHLHLPKLARHFDKENIHVTMYATQWLLTQYTSSFKFDLVTRVWDAFLGEGWKIIYRVMLALLQQWQSQLLKMSFEEILAFFRELPDRVNGNSVMETALRIKLKTRQIVRLEKEWRDKQQQ